MRTEIHLVGGERVSFDQADSDVRMNHLGVEVVHTEGDDVIRVLFPWTRIERVEQRGPGVTAVYKF